MPGERVRALRRNVFIYDLRDPSAQLGGLVLTRGITHANFYDMIDIVLVISSAYFLRDDNGETLPRDVQPLLPGNYFVVADGTVDINDRQVVARTRSYSTGTRLESFRNQVRERDGRCVVSKLESDGPIYGDWLGFEAAHIVPLACEQIWRGQGFGNLITIPPPPPRQQDTVNSVQNGLLLRAHLHQLFDSFYFSINPNDDYKIVYFQPDLDGIAGTFLDRRLLDDGHRPPDELFRWHFEQAVLTNMRGAGEPVFEHDFPPGSDMMGEIRDGPNATERMEFELFSRLGAHMILDH
ncbi:hypothetical protein AAE478_009649 [Parahypoxylon ruwenzoriense]